MLKLISIYPNEKEYRDDKTAINYSMLADFVKKSLRGFRKKYIDDDSSDDDDTVGMILGRLVHFKLSEQEELFDSLYYLSSITNTPKPQDLEFCKKLYGMTIKQLEDGVFTGDFSEMFQSCYYDCCIKTPKLPKFIENFQNNGGNLYYKDLLNSHGKTVLTVSDLELCEKIIDKCKKSICANKIFNCKDYKTELPIKFEYEGIVFKVLIDRLNIYEDYLEPWDYKVTSMRESKDFMDNYLNLRYYIQQSMYSKGVEALRNEMYPGKDTLDLKYLAIDNLGLYDSIIHSIEFNPINDPWTGFTYNGRYYKGIFEIIESLNWHKKNNIWDMSEETFNNNGFVKHKI